eukprot:8122791-Alexandrium_andersonii.AAC.1
MTTTAARLASGLPAARPVMLRRRHNARSPVPAPWRMRKAKQYNKTASKREKVRQTARASARMQTKPKTANNRGASCCANASL